LEEEEKPISQRRRRFTDGGGGGGNSVADFVEVSPSMASRWGGGRAIGADWEKFELMKAGKKGSRDDCLDGSAG